MFSESLKGVVTQKFSGGFAPRPPYSHRSLKYLDPPLSKVSVATASEASELPPQKTKEVKSAKQNNLLESVEAVKKLT